MLMIPTFSNKELGINLNSIKIHNINVQFIKSQCHEYSVYEELREKYSVA